MSIGLDTGAVITVERPFIVQRRLRWPGYYGPAVITVERR